jgi:hypothetical protein
MLSRPTTDQTAYVRARDTHCQAPHCRRPAHQCDLDHTRRWTDGGPTHEDNLTVLCRRHHRAKDHHGYRVHRTDDGLVWITPHGRAYPVPLGRELDNELEVTAYDPPRRFALEGRSGPVPLSIDHELIENDGKTVLRVHAQAEPGALYKLAEPMIKRTAEQELRTDFERLKGRLEAILQDHDLSRFIL